MFHLLIQVCLFIFFFPHIIRERPFEEHILHSDVIQQLSGKQKCSPFFGALMKHNWQQFSSNCA